MFNMTSMMIYVDPGEPNFDEYESTEEFLTTLDRYLVTDWTPLSFNKEYNRLSFKIDFARPELVSRFEKRDKLTIVLGQWLTNRLNSVKGLGLEK